MNPGLILIIRNTFPLHLSYFLFAALFQSENRKIFIYLICTQNPKTNKPLPLLLSLLYLSSLLYFSYYFILLLLIWNVVLDNHTVELGTQGFILFCRIARRREGEITLYSIPREFDITLESPLWGKYSADTTLCTWSPNVSRSFWRC